MAEKVEFELQTDTKEAVRQVNKLKKEFQKAGEAATKTGEEISTAMQVGNALTRSLDTKTAGLASKLLKVGKAAKLSGKAMKTALISSGIGAAVVAIGLLVQYWDEIKGLVNGVSSEQATLLKETEATLAANEKQLNTITQSENILKLQGKTEKEILAMKRAVTDESIANTKILLEQQKQTKKSQVEAAERNQKITKGFIMFLSAPLVVLLGLIDGITSSLAELGILEEGTKLTEGFLDFSSSILFDPKEAETKGNETIAATEEALLKLENTRAGYLLKDKQAAKAAAKDKTNDEIQAEKDKAAAIERIRKGLIDTEAEERAEKLRLIKQDFDEQIKLAEQYYGEESDKVKELKAAQKSALDAQQDAFDLTDKEKRLAKEKEDQEKLIEKLEIDKEFSNLSFEDQRNLLNERDEQLLNDTTLTEEQRTALTKQFGEARTNLAVSEQDAKLATLDAVGGGLQDLSSIAGEETAAGKALALAAATINTYAGIAGIWGAQPEGTATTTLIAKIAASIAVASAGFAAVKKIASTKVPATSGGGGGGGATSYSPPSIPAAFNIVGASGENQLADAIGSQTQRPARAYVVSNDVTTAQELDRNIIEGASIG